MATSETRSLIEALRGPYLRSLASKKEEFAEAIKAHNFRTMARIGHQLKGSGCSYGMPEISAIGARVEEAAQDRRLSLLEPLLEEWTAFMNITETRLTSPENS